MQMTHPAPSDLDLRHRQLSVVLICPCLKKEAKGKGLFQSPSGTPVLPILPSHFSLDLLDPFFFHLSYSLSPSSLLLFLLPHLLFFLKPQISRVERCLRDHKPSLSHQPFTLSVMVIKLFNFSQLH